MSFICYNYGAMPALVFRVPSADDEFDYLWYLLKKLSVSRRKGYDPLLPAHPAFDQIAQDPSTIAATNKDRLKRIFTEEIFKKEDYALALKPFEGKRDLIERCFPIFTKFQKEWEFKIYPKYEVVLTKYGTGAIYDPEDGIIVARGNSEDTSGDNLAESVIHEMVHLGIEENIVRRFNLTHWEKEELVDQICAVGLKEIIPDYILQDCGDGVGDLQLDSKSLLDLPVVIKRYIQNHPR